MRGIWSEVRPDSHSVAVWLEHINLIQRKREPVITVYETQANLADHEKIQGTDSGMSGMRFGA
jgi:hypothetical protein